MTPFDSTAAFSFVSDTVSDSARDPESDMLMRALATSFVDGEADSDPGLRAEFLSNDPKAGTKVVSVLEEELAACDRFSMSVAFVTMGGLTPLLETLRELRDRNVPGRILTTDYLLFSEPRAIEHVLNEFPNIEIRLYRTFGSSAGFHTKGYVFESGTGCRLIVGSSNLTQTALTTNREWNARLVSRTKGAFAAKMLAEFEALWRHPASRPARGELPSYRVAWEKARDVRRRLTEVAQDEEVTEGVTDLSQEPAEAVLPASPSEPPALEPATAPEIPSESASEPFAGLPASVPATSSAEDTGVPEHGSETDVTTNAETAAPTTVSAPVARPLTRFPALRPNRMQRDFVASVLKLVRDGARRALLISATGTGKTYASAFAVRALLGKFEADEPENTRAPRVLFLVHREQIARQARESYRRVLGSDVSSGLYTGAVSRAEREEAIDARIVFATVQTMEKACRSEDDGTLFDVRDFLPESFDLIVIDEVHRAAAASYLRIMRYFEPRFWLGMTASPDRPDGEDIYALFDHNIAYELRLQGALEEELLCPFHYFGIREFLTDAGEAGELADFARLACEERVDYILREASFHGWSGPRVKGLVFCRTNEEARALSDAFNRRGLRTLALSGADSQSAREAAIERLTADEPVVTGTVGEIGRERTPLDYIFTVDIFNEGVDIPDVNQVLLLRPTQSPIVFIQQLGRGLRKAPGKEYVVVVDFIGNYENNYLIPIALSGDRSYSKEIMRRYVATGSRLIPGASSIHFDPVSRERIYAAIDNAKTQTMKLLKESYLEIRRKLGRIPKLVDYEAHGSIDPTKFFEARGSYHGFLKCVEPDYGRVFTPAAESMLGYLSGRIGRGERAGEALLLQLLLADYRARKAGGALASEALKDGLKARFKAALEALERSRERTSAPPVTETHLASIRRLMTNDFHIRREDASKYPACVFIEPVPPENASESSAAYAACVLSDGGRAADEALQDEARWTGAEWRMSNVFEATLDENPDIVDELSDLADFVLARWARLYGATYRETRFSLYQTYTYEEVCRLLDWERNVNAQNIGGYFYDRTTKTMPVFVNYEKEEGAIAYADRFLSERRFVALSKRNRRPTSSDADHIFKRGAGEAQNRIYLFVRRNKKEKEAKAFYFLGEVRAAGEPISVEVPGANGVDPAFEIDYRLAEPVRSDIYAYLTA